MNAHAFPMCLTTRACPLAIMLVRSVSATLHPHVSNCFQMVTDFICLSGGIHMAAFHLLFLDTRQRMWLACFSGLNLAEAAQH